MPSLPADGTLLVATGHSQFSFQDQSSFPIGIIGLNPSTGAQFPVSTGGLFALPTYITQAPNQQLYISDLTAFGTGAILQVDLNTGQQRMVAQGGLMNGPNVLAYINGFLYVADEGDASGVTHHLIRVDPTTGQQQLITDGSNGGFSIPVGMAPAFGNNVYVADEPGNVQGTDPGKVWLVNLDTGQQTIVSSNNSVQGSLFNHPVDLALDASGNLIVVNTGSAADGFAGSVIRINPQTGIQTLVSSFPADSGLDSVEVGPDGTIFVGAISRGNSAGQIIAVNPTTGDQSMLSSGGSLSLVEGMRVFSATVQMIPTSTSITSSVSASVFGQMVTFTATISGQGTGTPTGTVQFQIDGSNVGGPVSVTTSGGVTTAAFSTTLTAGSHTVTANYSGDSNFAASSGNLIGGLVVGPAATTLAVSSSVGSSVFGQSVTFTATISGQSTGTPTGTVQFQIDGSNVGGPVSVTTSGGVTTAAFSTAILAAGSHTVTANYSGDGTFAASIAALPGGQMVNKASTSMIVNSSANPLVSGQSVTFTAVISVQGTTMPTGTVQFQVDGNNVGGPVSVATAGGTASASFSSSSLAVGTHTVTASYSGDTNFTATTGTLPSGQTIASATTATTTTVSASANRSVFGQKVTFTATVSVPGQNSSKPTGTVQFQIDGSNVGSPISVSTTGGVITASFSIATLTVGSHTVTASYSGATSFLASAGTLSGGHVVIKADTATVVTSSVNPSVVGQMVTFKATVTVSSPGSTAVASPTGKVVFYDNGKSIGQGNLSTTSGVTTATFSTNSLKEGKHPITAVYTNGDTSFNASPLSGVLSQIVKKKGDDDDGNDDDHGDGDAGDGGGGHAAQPDHSSTARPVTEAPVDNAVPAGRAVLSPLVTAQPPTEPMQLLSQGQPPLATGEEMTSTRTSADRNQGSVPMNVIDRLFADPDSSLSHQVF